jgi:hypothetical protein
VLSNIPAEGAAAVVKNSEVGRIRIKKGDGQPGTKAERVRMGRQAKQNGVLILQSAWILMMWTASCCLLRPVQFAFAAVAVKCSPVERVPSCL